ncbi:uncharacterized protein PG998_011992 [Apiospora kogelbergensis]|uniref:uncharacterized protein n=1 Tax=Apiospora kogelbergensis TaxID=1337665 RepID=UPI00312F314A
MPGEETRVQGRHGGRCGRFARPATPQQQHLHRHPAPRAHRQPRPPARPRHRRRDDGALVSETECIRALHRPTRPKLAQAAAHRHVGAYVVVGVVDAATGATRECLQGLSGAADDGRPRDFLVALRAAVRRLRPWHVRWFTLKTVGGFGLYECHRYGGGGDGGSAYHTVLDVSEATRLTLLELYHDFMAQRSDADEYWKEWVHQQFNAGDTFPGARRMGLRLILRWSVPKIIAYVATPVVASIIFGLVYTFTVTGPDVDRVAVLQTAWTVSSYMVTTAGVVVALLAAITSLRDH